MWKIQLKKQRFEILIVAVSIMIFLFVFALIMFICFLTSSRNNFKKKTQDTYFVNELDLEECPGDIDPEEYKQDKKDLALVAEQNATYISGYIKSVKKVHSKDKL